MASPMSSLRISDFGLLSDFEFRSSDLPPSPRSAFTLIEVLISAALMALIITCAYLCLSAGVKGQKIVEPRADIMQNARVAMSLMTADLRDACPLSKDFHPWSAPHDGPGGCG